jgi:hypothetical protein
MPYAHMFEHDDQQLGGRDQCRARRLSERNAFSKIAAA